MFASLAFYDYRLLWSGTIVTSTGQWMQQVAQGWLVLSLTNSAWYLGLVGFARGIPMLVLSPAAGVLIDRVDRRKVLMLFQMLSMCVAIVLAVHVASGLVRPWHVLVTSLLSGIFLSVVFPARQALVPAVVPRSHLANAVSLNSAGQNATRVMGPSLAGIVIGLVDVAGCFVLQAAGFVWAVWATFRLNLPSSPSVPGQRSVFGNLREGFGYIAGRKDIAALLLLAAVPTLFGMPYYQFLPAIAKDVLHTGPQGLGLLMGAGGIGSLLSSIWVASLGDFKWKGKLLLASATAFGLMLVLFAQSHWLLLSLALMVGVGASSAVYMAVNNTLLQLLTSDEMRGRVMSAYMMCWGLVPVGTLPQGAAASAWGASVAIAAGGAICALFVLVMAIKLPRLWRM
jgi:MFS family permease